MTAEEITLIKALNRRDKPVMDLISSALATFNGLRNTSLTLDDLFSRCRLRDVVDLRRYCVAVLHDNGMRPGPIGAALHIDRCTAIFHIRNHNDLMDVDATYRKEYHEITDNL